MLKNLPAIAVESIYSRLFNLELIQGIWPWDTSLVVFLKKEGKANYIKAGAYMPMSISFYVGKLLEKAIKQHITTHYDLENILDDEQTHVTLKIFATIK